MACTLTGLRRVWFLTGLFFMRFFFCKFILNSSCQCKPLPSRRGQWWRWQILLTSSLGALAGSGLLFLYPGGIMPLSFTTEVWTCVQIRLLLFRIQKLPYFMEFADHNLVFLIGVLVSSVNTCLVECSGIICNLGI
jgi:hypothetical protein